MVLFPFKPHVSVKRSKPSFMIQQTPPTSPRDSSLRVSFRAASSVFEETLTPTSRDGSIYYPSQQDLGVGVETQIASEPADSDQWIRVHPMMSNNPMWTPATEGSKQGVRWRFLGFIATGIATLCLSLSGLCRK